MVYRRRAQERKDKAMVDSGTEKCIIRHQLLVHAELVRVHGL